MSDPVTISHVGATAVAAAVHTHRLLLLPFGEALTLTIAASSPEAESYLVDVLELATAYVRRQWELVHSSDH